MARCKESLSRWVDRQGRLQSGQLLLKGETMQCSCVGCFHSCSDGHCSAWPLRMCLACQQAILFTEPEKAQKARCQDAPPRHAEHPISFSTQLPTVKSQLHPPEHKGRETAPPRRSRCKGCRGRTSSACIVARHCDAACPPNRLRRHRHAPHLCARIAHHGRPSIRILQQQNVLLKDVTLSRLLARYEPTGFPHPLQPACISTDCLWRHQHAQCLVACAADYGHPSSPVQASRWRACSSDCLVQARAPISKGRSWVPRGISRNMKRRMGSHLPDCAVALCVRHRSSPCIHPSYVCIACTSDNAGLCKDEGMHLSLEASAIAPHFMGAFSGVILQRLSKHVGIIGARTNWLQSGCKTRSAGGVQMDLQWAVYRLTGPWLNIYRAAAIMLHIDLTL